MNPDVICVDTPRGRFAARAAGESGHPLVLCLHGFLDDPSTFDHLLDWLAGHGFRAVAPYSRGYCPSPLALPAGEQAVTHTLALDLLAVANALQSTAPVSLLGHGSGATVVRHALAIATDRFDRAVTLANDGYRLPWLGRQLWVWGASVGVEAHWRRWAPGWVPNPAHAAAVNHTLAASGSAPLLTRPKCGTHPPIRTPVLHITGEHEGASGVRADQYVGSFREEVIPGAGYFLHHEQPTLVARAVVDWLATPTGPNAPACLVPGRLAVTAGHGKREPLRSPTSHG